MKVSDHYKKPARSVNLPRHPLFAAQAQRQDWGSGDCIELQFCRLPASFSIEKIVAVSNIEHWRPDSLYVHGDDLEFFIKEYGQIFTGGTYNNLKTGPCDLCGINYYPPEAVKRMTGEIDNKRPAGYDALLVWLQKAVQYNGIYILGL